MIIRSITSQNFNYTGYKKVNNAPIVINPGQISFNGRSISVSEKNIKPNIVLELYNHGFSQEYIAKMYNSRVGAIHEILHSNGIDTRNNGIKNYEPIPKDKAVIVELFNRGYSQKEIAEALDYSKDAVHFVLISNNIDTRGR